MSARPPYDLLVAAEPANAIAKLIPIGAATIGGVTVQTTDARDIYAFLEVGKDFSSWIKVQIVRTRLVENRDYTCSPSRVSSPSGTKHTIGYHLTLDAGKHVAMMSETEKGFEVREYFIECERRALAPASIDPLASLPPEQRALIAVMVDNANIKARQDEQANALADQAAVQVQQGAALTHVEQRVVDLAETMLVRTRPVGSESITHIRPRAAKMFGLPERIVEYVVRQSPMSIKPACMVRNEREEAEGGSFAVYWVKDINAVLRRFVGECEMVTACMATHPYIEGRFKLAPGG